MGLSRERAKKGVLAKDQNDPELDQVLSEGHLLQLELTKEKNRHALEMQNAALGRLGKFLGDGKNSPVCVAFIAMIAGLLLFAVCLIGAFLHPESEQFWLTQSDRSLAFASAAIAFIFGTMKSSK